MAGWRRVDNVDPSLRRGFLFSKNSRVVKGSAGGEVRDEY